MLGFAWLLPGIFIKAVVWGVIYVEVVVAREYLGEQSLQWLLWWRWCTFGHLGEDQRMKRKDREGELRMLEMSSQPWQSNKCIKRTFAASLQNHCSKMLGKKVAVEEGERNTSVFMSSVRYCDSVGNGQEEDEEAQGEGGSWWNRAGTEVEFESVLVPALLLRSQGDFQQAILGWGSLHFSMPNNKTDLLFADLLRSAAAAENHMSARYLFSFIW